MNASKPPIEIFAFVTDLFTQPSIESTAAASGFQLRFIEGLPGEGDSFPARPGEPLSGPAGDLVRSVSEARPALLIFDLSSTAIPWESLIAVLKSSAATRRVPILAFGAHKDAHTLKRAREAGADRVVARSRFMRAMPDLVLELAGRLDAQGLAAACRQPLSALARRGAELFNAGDYFEAHEILEEAWNEDRTAVRELYRAILQVAVAYLQIERGNYRGAAKMFLRLRQWIDPLPATCRGVDVQGLREAAYAVEAELLRLGEDGIHELDRSLFRPVRLLG